MQPTTCVFIIIISSFILPLDNVLWSIKIIFCKYGIIVLAIELTDKTFIFSVKVGMSLVSIKY